MHAVYTAIHTVRSWGVQKDMFSGKTSDPDSMIQTDELDLRERVQSSASASLKLVSEPQIVVWDEGEQGMRVVDTRMKSDALMNIMKLNHSLSNHEDHEFVSLDEITESEHQVCGTSFPIGTCIVITFICLHAERSYRVLVDWRVIQSRNQRDANFGQYVWRCIHPASS